VGSDPFAASDFDEAQRPPPHMAKDFLGAAVTLAVIGTILLQVTNRLASQCGAALHSRTGPGACSGLPAIANHAHGIMTLCVMACAALAVTAFIWYMLWGYKVNSQMRGNRDI
jgi:hypothetical protein